MYLLHELKIKLWLLDTLKFTEEAEEIMCREIKVLIWLTKMRNFCVKLLMYREQGVKNSNVTHTIKLSLAPVRSIPKLELDFTQQDMVNKWDVDNNMWKTKVRNLYDFALDSDKDFKYCICSLWILPTGSIHMQESCCLAAIHSTLTSYPPSPALYSSRCCSYYR